ncbi:hypothetical protein D3C81_1501040 [compost metagenome]
MRRNRARFSTVPNAASDETPRLRAAYSSAFRLVAAAPVRWEMKYSRSSFEAKAETPAPIDSAAPWMVLTSRTTPFVA